VKLPKVRVRALILLVAVAAIILGIGVDIAKRRRIRYLSDLVAAHAEREAYWTDQAAAMLRNEGRDLSEGRTMEAAIFASQAAYDRVEAQYHQELHRKYREALRRPGLPIEADPPRPPLYPRDYLSKVPYYVPPALSGP
jgi:hypothetical protein